MSYILIIGDRAYSSWSLRGWLLFEEFGLPYDLKHVTFEDVDDGDGWAALDAYPLANTVPTMITPDGAAVSDSLAIAEELATRHPEAGLWPSDPKARAIARTLASEMHSSFAALRGDCPMQLRHVNVGFVPSEAVQRDLARLETLWDHAGSFATDGPWLFGGYTLADVFYAPVCARIVGYGLPVSDRARAYCERTINDPAFQAWRTEALKTKYDPFPYDMELQTRDWPA